MRTLVSAILSVAILGAAYLFTFGVPDRLTQYVAGSVNDSAAAGAAGTDAQSGNQGTDAQSVAGDRGARATAVKTAMLVERPYNLILRTIGSARSRLDVSVTSSQAGQIVEQSLEANREVENGDVLLRLDDETERLALRIAEATRDKALDTVTRMRQSGNLSITQAELSEAELDLRLAESNVSLAQHALDERAVLAPITGQLGLSDLSVGDRVSVGDVIVTIDDASTVFAEFEVPERSIALLRIGREVLIGTPTYRGRIFKGLVTSFDSRLDSVSRSATVRAEIDNSDALLVSGMTFAIRVIDETAPLPVVPATAVTWTRDGAGIWVVNDGSVTRRQVAIRYRDGDSVWLDTEVPVGASIVIEGAAKLREGGKISTPTVEIGADS